MKKVLLCLTLVGLVVFALGGTARALSAPTVGAIIPASAPNDRDTPVVITGTGFATDGVTPPTVTLGATPLTAVTFVNDTTLTATVPTGLTPGLYALTVTNPDTGSASLPGAFTVTAAPTVTAIEPSTAYNDIDTAVTITGTDFATGAGGTVLPTATLNGVPLADVAFVSATTLAATVPWGMDTGPYVHTVTNTDGGTGSLSSAFTVEAGIGKWNSGVLWGGQVNQILMKPGDPDTLYVPAYRIHGLFRSTDAGEHWTYTGADLPLGNGRLAVDPLNPGWLYAGTYKGLQRSQDDGDTWTVIMPRVWPDARNPADTRVFPSPFDAGVLFVSAHDDYGFPASGGALGLIKSTDAGTNWHIVADLEGISVANVAFDPADHQKMVLVTSDARVFRSTDRGDSWSEVAKPPLSGVGPAGGAIAYNPYRSGEVWIASGTPCGIFKSTDLAAPWENVTEADGMGGWDLTFTGPDSVYTTRHHSTDGGSTWELFGPTSSYGQLRFDPRDPQVAYIGDDTFGVQKTTDGGLSWAVKNQGLAGMYCWSVDVSPADPLRVYATFEHWSGTYRSDDGTNDWTYLPIADSGNVRWVHEDPFAPQHVYVAADSGFYATTDGGESWSDLGWNMPPSSPAGMPWGMATDPQQPGHLLVGIVTGPYATGQAYLYSSSDAGVSWQAVTMPQPLKKINDIAFDPGTPGLVYLTTDGTGVYRSADSGDSWARIDDPAEQPGLQSTGEKGALAIATHPQHLVTVAGSDGYLYRSDDEGVTWQRSASAAYPGYGMFVDGDSTRLYRGTGDGLFFSKDVGDTWTRAAGAFGHLQIMDVDYAIMDGRAIIYAATNGGQAGTSSAAAAAGSRRAAAAPEASVAAGVYRYVVVDPALTLKLSGLREGTLRLGHRVTAKGVVTPASLAGDKVTLTVQRRHDGRWRAVASRTRTVAASGAYSWTYQPAKSGVYRVRASMSKTATHTAARTAWRTFKVK